MKPHLLQEDFHEECRKRRKQEMIGSPASGFFLPSWLPHRPFRWRLAFLAAALLTAVPSAAGAGWDPLAWADEDTVELYTVEDGEGHWSTVWIVVLDGEPYLRLGSRAARRIEENDEAPFVRLRVAGEELERVRAAPAPEKEEAVAKAMAEKYWSDVLIRFVPHPLTVRLVPAGGDEPGAAPE